MTLFLCTSRITPYAHYLQDIYGSMFHVPFHSLSTATAGLDESIYVYVVHYWFGESWELPVQNQNHSFNINLHKTLIYKIINQKIILHTILYNKCTSLEFDISCSMMMKVIATHGFIPYPCSSVPILRFCAIVCLAYLYCIGNCYTYRNSKELSMLPFPLHCYCWNCYL